MRIMPVWPKLVSKITSAGGSTFVRTIAGLATSVIPEAGTTEAAGETEVVTGTEAVVRDEALLGVYAVRTVVAAGAGAVVEAELVVEAEEVVGAMIAIGAMIFAAAEPLVEAGAVVKAEFAVGAGTIVRAEPVCAEVVLVTIEALVEMEAAGGASVVDVGAEADCRVVVLAKVGAVARTDTVRGADAPVVFAGRKPNALTGAEVNLSSPPNKVVAFPAIDEPTRPAALAFAGPALSPRGLRPAVVAFEGFASGTFPPTGLFTMAGSSWLAPGNPMVALDTTWATTPARASAHPRTQDNPTSDDKLSHEFRNAIASDMAGMLIIHRFIQSSTQSGHSH
jgi:hypothetical protein